MAFRCPSAAQARALGKIDEVDGPVLWVPAKKNVYGQQMASLYFEVQDREANTAHLRSVGEYKADQIRILTLTACLRYGWVEIRGDRVFASGLPIWRVHGGSADTVVTQELRLTDDGDLALGLWRERQLNAPPAPLPELSGDDRLIVELAARAAALGFVVMPVTEDARLLARRLARGPYARRGWGAGAGTRSITATEIGVVEVLPECADIATAELPRWAS